MRKLEYLASKLVRCSHPGTRRMLLWRVPSVRCLVAAALAVLQARADYQLEIAPAPVDRAGLVVSFELPQDAPRNLELVDGAQVQPVQVDAGNRGTIVLAQLKANEGRVLQLRESAVLVLSGAVKADIEKGGIVRISIDGSNLFDFWAMDEPLPDAKIDPRYLRGGHIHPVRSPAGKILTSSYPADHLHHHGIWAAWTKTRFQDRDVDFWNVGRSPAKVEFAGLDRIWSGPTHGGFVSRQRYIDAGGDKPVTVLDERWEVTAYRIPAAGREVRVFDLVSTQDCATNEPLILPTYHYGGVGFRGRDEWIGEANLQVLTSENITDRVKAHTSRVRWIHLGGKVEGGFAGVAVLGHPGNFRAPQPIRLHPREPFLCFAPSQLGDWEIRPGTTYVSRYRYVALDGPAEHSLLEAYWNGYAHPAQVTLRKL